MASIYERFGVFIATRVRQEKETENATCLDPNQQTCAKLWSVTYDETIFVTAIEDFTVLIDHAAQVPAINWFYQARDIPGRLKVPDFDKDWQHAKENANKLCKDKDGWSDPSGGSHVSSAPCYIDPNHPPSSTLDVFTVSTLLTAAGVDLDTESYAGSNHSARYEGMTMLVSIDWVNNAPWTGTLSEPYYVYSLTAMPKNAFGLHQTIWDPYRQNRTLMAVHGIMLQGNLIGDIGAFEFNTLLLQLTASVTLLLISSTIVDYAARFGCKYRKYYSTAMVDVTADFSEAAHLEEMTIDALRQECRNRALAHGGQKNRAHIPSSE
jgi:hypothetical protein